MFDEVRQCTSPLITHNNANSTRIEDRTESSINVHLQPTHRREFPISEWVPPILDFRGWKRWYSSISFGAQAAINRGLKNPSFQIILFLFVQNNPKAHKEKIRMMAPRRVKKQHNPFNKGDTWQVIWLYSHRGGTPESP